MTVGFKQGRRLTLTLSSNAPTKGDCVQCMCVGLKRALSQNNGMLTGSGAAVHGYTRSKLGI